MNNYIYCIDILNETFYQKRSQNKLELPNVSSLKKLGFSSKDYVLPITFLSEFVYSSKDNKIIAKKLLKNNTINNEEANAIYLYGQKYVERNNTAIEKLYETNQETLKEISNDLLKLGNVVQNYREEQKTKLKNKTLKK